MIGSSTNDGEGADRSRTLGGVSRLLGERGLERLRRGHVAVVGVGGVGSWAAEALARSGVGRLTLIDLDHVAESNLNRQVHATGPTIGQAKVDAMAERIARFAPGCAVVRVEAFVERGSVGLLLPEDAVVIDATDQASAKVAMAVWCRERAVPLVMCGAAGGRTDPLALVKSDLARTEQDALLARVRSLLRRHHGFPRDRRRRFGIVALHSTQPLQDPTRPVGVGGAPLACAGYGSIVTVTATMGMVAAAAAMDSLVTDFVTDRAGGTDPDSAESLKTRRPLAAIQLEKS